MVLFVWVNDFITFVRRGFGPGRLIEFCPSPPLAGISGDHAPRPTRMHINSNAIKPHTPINSTDSFSSLLIRVFQLGIRCARIANGPEWSRTQVRSNHTEQQGCLIWLPTSIASRPRRAYSPDPDRRSAWAQWRIPMVCVASVMSTVASPRNPSVRFLHEFRTLVGRQQRQHKANQ